MQTAANDSSGIKDKPANGQAIPRASGQIYAAYLQGRRDGLCRGLVFGAVGVPVLIALYLVCIFLFGGKP